MSRAPLFTPCPQRTRAESALRHLDIAEARLREEAVIAFYRRDYGAILQLSERVGRLERFLADMLPEGV